MTVEFDETLSQSLYINGCQVNSCCEFAPGSLLLAVTTSNFILIAMNWIVVRETEVSGKFSVSDSLLLPGFDINSFPFLLESGKNSYNIINVLSGNRDVLIQGSAQTDYR